MPIYATKCSKCGRQDNIWRRVEARDELPICECGTRVERIVSAPMIAPDILEPFVSPSTGRLITSRASLHEDFARSGNIQNEPGLAKDIARWGEERKAKTFAPIEKAVDETVASLVSAGKIES